MHGWIVLDKPQGITCVKSANIFKRILGVKKIGHIGTLDPQASGVLLLAIGEATKLIPHIDKKTKIYQFDVTFGAETSTLDQEGEITQTTSSIPSQDEILKVIPQLTGWVDQVPPRYSAIHIDGKRAYDIARSGQEFDMPTRLVYIGSLNCVKQKSETCFQFEVTCGPGTYVRSLARDIARRLRSLGYVSHLRRIKDGKFNVQDAVSLEIAKEIGYNCVKSVEYVLDDIPALHVDEQQAELIQRGMAVSTHDSVKINGFEMMHRDNNIALFFNQKLISIARLEDDLIFPVRNFNLER
ncbi:MAG: tRNA pseudouridine(55) synthase TruB [Candidatus Puniceispirillum sp.]|nr:tRNA pseudouridine(55) synthase TruB [Candidatus Pelagibacter sp.]MBA4282986.1 tRNA pseudouridine(55) synthase TruB [Candidatus Puniceispirillum sp.]